MRRENASLCTLSALISAGMHDFVHKALRGLGKARRLLLDTTSSLFGAFGSLGLLLLSAAEN